MTATNGREPRRRAPHTSRVFCYRFTVKGRDCYNFTVKGRDGYKITVAASPGGPAA